MTALSDASSRTANPDDPEEADEHPVVRQMARDVSLGQGARQGAAWIGGARVAGQVFQFAVSIITARLLLPSQFGQAALVLAVTAFGQLFTDLGLAAAVVHARRATREVLSTAFWVNLVTGLALTLIVVGLSFPLSSLYGQPSLAPLLWLASLNFVLSCGVVQMAILERTFNYKRLAIVETLSLAVGIAAVPIAALAGAGTASLVIGPLLSTILLSAGLWGTVRWRPDVLPTRRAVGDLWRYSRGLVGFNAVNYWSRNLDTLLLGRYASAGHLGEYTRSFSLTMIPVTQMSLVLGRVLFPALARLQDEPRRMGLAWARGMSAAGSLALPLTVTLAATAPSLVAVLYGPRWAGMVPVLQLLAIATVPQIVAASTGNVFRAAGRTGLLFRLGLISSGLSVVAIVAALALSDGGTVAVAAALMIKSWVALPISLVPLARIVRLSAGEMIRACFGVGWPCGALAVGELVVRWAAPDTFATWQTLFMQLALGGGLYLAVLWFMDAPVIAMARERLAERRMGSA